jgi:hypothetical protein
MPNTFSGTYTQYSTDDYISEALERCQIRGDQINPDHIQAAIRSSNFMLAYWAADGFKQYDMQLATIDFTPGVSVYAQTLFPAGTLQIFSSVIRTNNAFDVPMVRISRYDYEQIPFKADVGRPDRFFWDGLGNTLAQRYMQLWPVPNLTYTARVWCICRSQDMGNITNSPDIGFEWVEAFTAGLAARLAQKYRPDLYQQLKMEAGGPDMPPNPQTGYNGGAYLVAKRGERERGPLRLRVDWRTKESPR